MGEILEIAIANLTSPIVLFFGLGIIIAFAKAKVEIPNAISDFISIYLLIAIGFKGGVAIAEYGMNSILLKIIGALILGAFIPVYCYFILRKLGKFSNDNAAAIAGHYGSVSVVTFMAGTIFLSNQNISYEGYLNGFPAIMEVPGIAVALFLASWGKGSMETDKNGDEFSIGQIIKQVVLSKSVVLLLGAMMVGYVTGPKGAELVIPFYRDIFYGMLSLFMLELGMIAASKFGEFRRAGLFLIFFGTLIPILSGFVGAITGVLVGLSVGGITLLAILAASSSYIVAPAAMRISLPKANPALYLGVSIGITLPFNLIIGIPIYYYMAVYLTTILN